MGQLSVYSPEEIVTGTAIACACVPRDQFAPHLMHPNSPGPMHGGGGACIAWSGKWFKPGVDLALTPFIPRGDGRGGPVPGAVSSPDALHDARTAGRLLGRALRRRAGEGQRGAHPDGGDAAECEEGTKWH